MAGGGKRRNVQTMPIPSKEHLLNIIKAHTNLSLAHKAFISFLYLTGARVGEICANRPDLKKDLVIVRKTGWAVYREYISGHDWRGITIGQLSFKEIEFKSTGQKKFVCLIENVPTEKRRGEATIFRHLPIDVEKDKEFIEIFDQYLDAIKQYPTQPLFPFYRHEAFMIIKQFDPTWFPHFVRHIRLTHLAVDRDYTDIELKQITGWADTRPAEKYVHLRWHDIVRKHF